jgi:hypothetical protein
MTRDEHRAKYIEAIADELEPDWRRLQKIDWAHGIVVLRKAARIFDSLHGIARVVPVEATQEMELKTSMDISGRRNFDIMSAAGDLTNDPDVGLPTAADVRGILKPKDKP